MDPGAIYAVLTAAVLIAVAALVFVAGILHSRPPRAGAWDAALTRSRLDHDPDVGRCIIAGCPNWSEDPICSTCEASRMFGGLER